MEEDTGAGVLGDLLPQENGAGRSSAAGNGGRAARTRVHKRTGKRGLRRAQGRGARSPEKTDRRGPREPRSPGQQLALPFLSPPPTTSTTHHTWDF